jgi:hypothetical protein
MILIDSCFGFCIFFPSVVCFCFHHCSWVAKLLAFVSPLSFCLYLFFLCVRVSICIMAPFSIYKLLCFLCHFFLSFLFHDNVGICINIPLFWFFLLFFLLHYCNVCGINILNFIHCCDILYFVRSLVWILL